MKKVYPLHFKMRRSCRTGDINGIDSSPHTLSIPFHLQLIILFAGCCLWPELGFADDLLGAITEHDYSIRFLSNIFGVVDGVLHGSGSQIFGAMFGAFNSGVLTLGTTILGYTLFVSTLRTAHEGEALGRNWSSMWIPFKSATGFALLLPKASGYSMIQIFVMWVVVQGVGAGNLIWNTALNYLNSGGAIVQPNTPSLKGSVELAGGILRSEVCMFMIEQSLQEQNKQRAQLDPDAKVAGTPSFAQSITAPTTTSQPNFTGSQPSITFPGILSDGTSSYFTDKVCGTVSWSTLRTGDDNDNRTIAPMADPRSLAVLQVITDLIPYAQQIAKDYGPFPSDIATQTILNNLSGTILTDAGNDYEGIVGPAVNLLNSDKARSFLLSDAQDEGWIMAGSYYQALVTLNRNYATDELHYPSTPSFPYPPSDTQILPKLMSGDATRLTNFFSTDDTKSVLKKYINANTPQTQSSGIGNAIAIESYNVGSGIGGQILAFFTEGLSSVIQGYIELWSNTGGTGAENVLNPVTSAATLGSGLVSFVASVWLGGAAGVLGLTALVAICPAVNSIGTAINSFLTWLMPMLTVVMVTMFVLGATLAYYIPMVPYILFLFGGLGWLIGVIESMAAAPLVALGIAYPEEHEILGKAQPAIMLLTNIFIRPSLMVIGFIAGISLSYVGIWLLNAGFARAASAMTAGTQGLAWIFLPISMISIYTALVVQIINQAFGLIHVIPDEVLRWISGAPTKQFGEAQGEQAVRAGFKEDMSSIGKGAADHRKAAEENKNKAGGSKPKNDPTITTT